MPAKAELSKLPKNNIFKQQRLPIWQPIITTRTCLPALFAVGALFIPVGIALILLSASVNEHVVDYTMCSKVDESGTTCYQYLAAYPSSSCQCKMEFELSEDFKRNVFMYYGLTDYYQNYRLYVRSRDDEQLMGKLSEKVSSQCRPMDSNGNKTIVPCGLIANSMFNDTLRLQYRGEEVPLLDRGIAWPSDIEMRFRNPPGDLRTALESYSKPLYWQKQFWQLDPEEPSNNGFENEDFIVWMRTACLPNFRKLYRRIDHSHANFQNGMKSGNYTLIVTYQYPVHTFKGTKKMILSNTSVLGGKNPWLGIIYIVTGCIYLIIGVVLLFIHMKYSKRTSKILNVNVTTSYSYKHRIHEET